MTQLLYNVSVLMPLPPSQPPPPQGTPAAAGSSSTPPAAPAVAPAAASSKSDLKMALGILVPSVSVGAILVKLREYFARKHLIRCNKQGAFRTAGAPNGLNRDPVNIGGGNQQAVSDDWYHGTGTHRRGPSVLKYWLKIKYQLIAHCCPGAFDMKEEHERHFYPFSTPGAPHSASGRVGPQP